MIKQIEKKLDRKVVVFAAIALLTLIVYSNSFSAPFTLDDYGSITNNYAIRNPLDISAIWKFYSNRFFLYFTLSLNYYVNNNAVVGYHIVNVILHIANGIIVYLILNSILGLNYFSNRLTGKYSNLISILSSFVFVCHPVQVNAVTYIIQRTASLAATFYLLSILFFIIYRISDKSRYFIFTIISMILAMFTKENTITIPFMLILIELMFFLKDGKTSWKKRIIFIFILLLTVPIIPGTNLFLKGYSQSDPNVSFKASTSMDRFQYFYTELNVITLYIRQLFIPDNLNFDYSNDFPVSKTIWDNYSYISFLVLSLIGLTGLLNIKKNKLLSFGIFWFFIGLAVESSFISIKDVYFEHRLYFPLAGFVISIIGLVFYKPWFSNKLYCFKKPVLFFVVIMCFMTVMYSGLTLYRNYIFSDGIRLWADVVKKAPKSDRAHSVLATKYLDDYEANKKKNKGYLDIAETEFKKAISLYYNNSTAHCNLSKVYLLKGDYKKCIDEANITNSISKSKYAYFNIGSAHEKMEETDAAIKAYLEGYNLDKKCTFILKALGNAYNDKLDYENAKYYYEEYLKNNEYKAGKKEVQKKIDEINIKLSETDLFFPPFTPFLNSDEYKTDQ